MSNEHIPHFSTHVYAVLDFVKDKLADLETAGIDMEQARGGFAQRDHVELVAALDEVHDRMVRLHIAVYGEAPTK